MKDKIIEELSAKNIGAIADNVIKEMVDVINNNLSNIKGEKFEFIIIISMIISGIMINISRSAQIRNSILLENIVDMLKISDDEFSKELNMMKQKTIESIFSQINSGATIQ